MRVRRERFKRRIICRWFGNHLPSTLSFICTVMSCFPFPYCSARDIITDNNLLNDGQNLVSTGERYELGFFSPTDSFETEGIQRYIGIWYYKSNPRILIWVANRERPLHSNDGVLAVDRGNLKLFDGRGYVYWSTEAESSSSVLRVAKLMDSGNFVLKDDQVAVSLWESFKNPTNTFLAGMYMDENLWLTSWTSEVPNAKNFTFKMAEGKNQYQILKHFTAYWKSADDTDVFNLDEIIPYRISCLLSNFSMPNCSPSQGTRLIMNSTGEIQYWTEDKLTGWSLIWLAPKDNCSMFHYCGNFGICSSIYEQECKCLQGFVPTSPENWNSGKFSGGCTRKTNPLWDRNDVFSRFKTMQASKPDFQIPDTNGTECLDECLKRSKCQAYSYKISDRRGDGGTCWIWTNDLKNLKEDLSSGHDLYVRMPASEPGSVDSKPGGVSTQQNESYNGRKKPKWTLIFGVTFSSVILLSCIVMYFYTRRHKMNSQEGGLINQPNTEIRFYDRESHVKDMVGSDQFKEEDKKCIDLPFFDFEYILEATDNFSEANKLGKGGFGPVYKGKFLEGQQQIAIKRLSSESGQGLEEFKNEVVLIARLQHRNLVRLLGYCIEGYEKILLYEYMPNKSLDIFIFDQALSVLLDWETRFNIIVGVSRGLLYLHQDSRLRIIHRDLKTSNILLDQEMNPKISDFGLARIFEGKQTEGTTNRVVGTYGYMSPEYALDGFFSVKSDVFSYGVVVLEIISGKRNTGFYNSQQALSLLGYAWKLWQEGKALEMMDQTLQGSSRLSEILKCITIGLLCVQEDPNDRPNMSNVVLMLSSEASNLLSPKPPAFAVRRELFGSASSSTKPDSNKELTVTVEGR